MVGFVEKAGTELILIDNYVDIKVLWAMISILCLIAIGGVYGNI